uniref:Uncharacterized protein n=1 Tax=Arabidopsis thaliana TaxID=3702 RepID=Q0WPT3_ARATH|nr:hypothetical protein [Arabidopsis thaliana]
MGRSIFDVVSLRGKVFKYVGKAWNNAYLFSCHQVFLLKNNTSESDPEELMGERSGETM